MLKWKADGNDILWEISPAECSLALTLNCGQCFRFEQVSENAFEGVALGRILHLTQEEDAIRFRDMDAVSFIQIYAPYFDAETDYAAIKSSFRTDPILEKAILQTEGIRILRQDGFETLISFIISQNNNIPRIKKGIRLLCEGFGERIAPDKYAFPTPDILAACKPNDFSGLSLGYRDRYIIDAAKRVAAGDICLNSLYTAPIEKARTELLRIIGVGPKVAECVLLFGFGRHMCFPMDTWMKKVMKKYYPNGFPTAFRSNAGIAQQYLFHYARHYDSFA